MNLKKSFIIISSLLGALAQLLLPTIAQGQSEGEGGTCLEVYQQHSKKGRFAEEIKFVQTLEQGGDIFGLLKNEPYKKFAKYIQSVPYFSQEEFQFILSLGFTEQIFCNPDPLPLQEIFERLGRGHFFPALRDKVQAILHPNSNQDLSADADSSRCRKISSNGLQQVAEQLEKLSQKSPFPPFVSHRNPLLVDQTGYNDWFLNPSDHKLYVHPREDKGRPGLVLRGGELNEIPKNEKLGLRPYWHPHDGTGVPNTLAKDEYIKEFQVASEIVVSVSDKRKVHLYKPTEFKLPTTWDDHMGCPLGEELYMPFYSAGWTFGCAIKVKPDTRRVAEFMAPEDIVHYFEDGIGNKFDFAFTATIFSLDPNGRVIRYTDTGLPGGWARGFTTPNRGMFKAVNLSSAGSTILVIGEKDKEGQRKMYTRMYDYEIMGSCPGNYSSFDSEKDQDESIIHPISEGYRRRPLPGWVEVAPVPLKGEASLSNRISLFLTGQGNGAREMRVMGTNEKGQSGYYHKLICSDQWNFVVTNEPISDFEPTPLVKSMGKMMDLKEGQKFAMDYVGGKITNGGPKNFTVDLLDFHPYLGDDEPSTVRVHTSSGKSFDLDFHTLDAWILTPQKRNHEMLVGDAEGEPKVLLGTLRVPDAVKNSDDLEIQKIVKDHFLPYHNKVDAFSVLADSVKVTIEAKKEVDGVKKPLNMNFTRKDDAVGYYDMLANLDYLQLGAQEVPNKNAVLAKIARNEEMLKTLEETQNSFWTDFKKGVISKAVSGLVGPVRFFGKAVDLEKSKPELKSIFDIMPMTLGQHASLNFQAAFSSSPIGYKQAVQIVKKRIHDYKKVLENF